MPAAILALATLALLAVPTLASPAGRIVIHGADSGSHLTLDHQRIGHPGRRLHGRRAAGRVPLHPQPRRRRLPARGGRRDRSGHGPVERQGRSARPPADPPHRPPGLRLRQVHRQRRARHLLSGRIARATAASAVAATTSASPGRRTPTASAARATTTARQATAATAAGAGPDGTSATWAPAKTAATATAATTASTAAQAPTSSTAAQASTTATAAPAWASSHECEAGPGH